MFPSAWSYFDILFLGVFLVGFLGFGGTLFYESQRWGRWYNSRGILDEASRITATSLTPNYLTGSPEPD
jgi:hypothetical protein